MDTPFFLLLHVLYKSYVRNSVYVYVYVYMCVCVYMLHVDSGSSSGGGGGVVERHGWGESGSVPKQLCGGD